MSKEITAQGQYSVKDSGEVVTYDFSYLVLDSVQDAIDTLGEEKVRSLIQRQIKVDANNLEREKTKAKNGHSSRPVMSEEDKAKAKAERAELRSIAQILKQKGLSLEDIENL